MIKAIITGMILVVALMAESQANYLNDDQHMMSVMNNESSAPNPQPASLGMNPSMDISVMPEQAQPLSVKTERAPRSLEVTAPSAQSIYKESKLGPYQSSKTKSLRLLCLFAMLKSNGSARVLDTCH